MTFLNLNVTFYELVTATHMIYQLGSMIHYTLPCLEYPRGGSVTSKVSLSREEYKIPYFSKLFAKPEYLAAKYGEKEHSTPL